MSWASKQITALRALVGKLTGEDKTAAERELAELEAEAGRTVAPEPPATPPQNPPPGDPNAAIAQAIAQAMAPFQAKIDAVSAALADERKARESAVQALETERTQQRAKEIDETIAAAISTGKIPNDDTRKAEWKSRLEKDFETVKAIVDELPGAPAIKGQGGHQQGGARTSGTQQPGAQAGRAYTSRFAASMPRELMQQIEQDIPTS